MTGGVGPACRPFRGAAHPRGREGKEEGTHNSPGSNPIRGRGGTCRPARSNPSLPSCRLRASPRGPAFSDGACLCVCMPCLPCRGYSRGGDVGEDERGRKDLRERKRHGE